VFKRKTLFVLGAGASFEAGLPLGAGLATTISTKMNILLDHDRHTGTGDRSLFEGFRRFHANEMREYQKAAWLTRDGLPLARSIDDFLDLHKNNARVTHYAKATIVKTILEAEKRSKLWVDPSNIYNTIPSASIADTWYVKFMHLLTPGGDIERLDTLFENIAFIIFNYDRCLEHFLVHAIAHLYGVDLRQSYEVVGKINIVHPYGSVGRLLLPHTDQTGGVPFGGERDYVMAAKEIKTYTEQITEGEDVTRMKTMVEEAKTIIFLGFAFHEPNMTLLRPDLPIMPIPIYATAYGMSDDDSESCRNAIGGFIKSSQGATIRIRKELTCSGLFDNYSRSLNA
jgi:hypothetical protein